MNISDQLVKRVIEDVLAGMGKRPKPVEKIASATSGGHDGVFTDVSAAVAAAKAAQARFERMGTAERAKAVDVIRTICREQAEPLGREEFLETRIGRLDHKIEKLKIAADRIPGVEFLKTDAFSGGQGVSLQEFAPFGVVGIITPVTHSLPTLAGNAINLLASGNAFVCNPHPSGAKIACKGVQLFNRGIAQAIGVENLLTIIAEPTLDSAQAIFDHRDVKLLCVTGGPAVARAALRSNKRAIVAGPGNPPVVVDETADLDNAARSIIQGAAYDNNLLCIGEKEVFAVAAIFDELLAAMRHAGAVQLDRNQVAALTQAAFITGEGGKLMLNKDLVGKDPAELAKAAGFALPQRTELLFGETDEANPFVDHEQMMPFVPFVRVPDVATAIALAKKYEHGFKHTAILHSRNLDTVAWMARELDTTLFAVNGPCTAALGSGGEGYMSFSIATPTGEGVTTPLTFTRQRRLTLANGLRIL
jgi:aldehyde dehydrogenase